MPALTPSQVHLDVPLTNLVTAYMQSDAAFIADRIFPNVTVDKQSNKYYKWDRDFYNRIGDVKAVAPGTEVEEISLSLSNDSYFCNVFGLGISFTEQQIANEDTQLQVREMGARTLVNRMRLKRELDFISNYFTTGVWTTNYTGVSTTPSTGQVLQWNDANSTPIEDITLAKTAMYLASAGTSSYSDIVLVVTQDVYDVLKNHPDILARISGGATTANPALITATQIAGALEVAEVMVFRAIQNTAAEGLGETLSFVATKKAALYSRPAAPGLMVPASGYTFTWGGVDNAMGLRVNSYTGDYLAVKHVAEKLEVLMAYDQKLCSADMGVFFNTIIA